MCTLNEAGIQTTYDVYIAPSFMPNRYSTHLLIPCIFLTVDPVLSCPVEVKSNIS